MSLVICYLNKVKESNLIYPLYIQGQCDDYNDENGRLTAEDLQEKNLIQQKCDIIKESPDYNDCSTDRTSKSEEEQGETSNLQEKILKKPDKILPCPLARLAWKQNFVTLTITTSASLLISCKNCQRYWTAGGTMEECAYLPNGARRPPLKINGTILTFDTDKPLCESMVPVLNSADKAKQTCAGKGFHKYKEPEIQAGDNGDDHCDGSSVTAVSSKDSDNGLPDMLRQTSNNFPPHLPCFTGATWPYPWSSMNWSNAVPPPGYYLPGIPMPFFPATNYWGCTHRFGMSLDVPTPLHPKTKCLRLLRVILGSAASWLPKTLRIDDPGEAAKSSIWATLGIKHEVVDSVGGGLLKAFLPKTG
ncbi:hypothetical protein HAX54_005393 [Datura stramonium]|uniref:Dof-type domain-containing protein n=1 Tax=Datura stramonium TaxID=4076 RepID=A0ABS8T8N3_DATST|nr:hypothetical protein [Datura stramonium]